MELQYGYKKMNKNEDFKLLRQHMKDEAAKLAIEKERERLKWEEVYRVESIQKAIDKYPMILENFKNSTDFLVDEFFEVNNYTYNITLDNIYFTSKVAELLKADGFEVIWIDNAGWDAGVFTSKQPPYKSIRFKLK